MLTICTYDEKHVTYGENRENNKNKLQTRTKTLKSLQAFVHKKLGP